MKIHMNKPVESGTKTVVAAPERINAIKWPVKVSQK